MLPAKLSFFTTAAAFYTLFHNLQLRRLRGLGPARRVAYTSAAHAVWLQKVVSSIMTRESEIERHYKKKKHVPVFAGLVANPKNKLKREGPESFPRILFANSGNKRLGFMKKMASHISRTAEIRFNDLSIASWHLSGEIANSAEKQRMSFLANKDKTKALLNESIYNDKLNYRRINTTKIIPVRRKDGTVEMISPASGSGGALSAFLDLDRVLNKRKYLLKYISALSRILVNEAIPETLKRSGGGMVEGALEAINALKVFFLERHRDFVKKSMDAVNSQSADIFFAPFMVAEPAALDYNDRPAHREFANELNERNREGKWGESSDLVDRAPHLD